MAIGCPKLDDLDAYIDKVAEILRVADVKSLKVVHMEVPCCHGLVHIAREALKKAGKGIPLKLVKVGIKGEVLETDV